MFVKYDDSGFSSPVDGIELKTLAFGEKTNLTRFHLKKDSLLPSHSHPNEQTGVLFSGCIRLWIGEESFLVEPGDSWTIQAGIEHRAEILQDSVAIEVFAPRREDYLPKST